MVAAQKSQQFDGKLEEEMMRMATAGAPHQTYSRPNKSSYPRKTLGEVRGPILCRLILTPICPPHESWENTDAGTERIDDTVCGMIGSISLVEIETILRSTDIKLDARRGSGL